MNFESFLRRPDLGSDFRHADGYSAKQKAGQRCPQRRCSGMLVADRGFRFQDRDPETGTTMECDKCRTHVFVPHPTKTVN